MTLLAQLDCPKATVLRSGQFYAVQAIHRCYRINEPDHFLQDQHTRIYAFLDQEGVLHYFNRPSSRLSASSSLEEVLHIQGLKEVDFWEVSEPVQQQLKGLSLPGEQDQTEAQLLWKAVEAFSRQQTEEKEFDVEELKQTHMEDYIRPPDLPV